MFSGKITQYESVVTLKLNRFLHYSINFYHNILEDVEFNQRSRLIQIDCQEIADATVSLTNNSFQRMNNTMADKYLISLN